MLDELDAFYLEHRRCSALDGGVRDGWVWLACSCGALLARARDAAPSAESAPPVWNRAFSDYTGLNGHAWGYSHYLLEGGDKMFACYDGTTRTTVAAGGTRKTTSAGVITLTGGTGKFRGIRGTIRTTSVFDPKANVSETQDEGEYWIE